MCPPPPSWPGSTRMPFIRYTPRVSCTRVQGAEPESLTGGEKRSPALGPDSPTLGSDSPLLGPDSPMLSPDSLAVGPDSSKLGPEDSTLSRKGPALVSTCPATLLHD